MERAGSRLPMAATQPLRSRRSAAAKMPRAKTKDLFMAEDWVVVAESGIRREPDAAALVDARRRFIRFFRSFPRATRFYCGLTQKSSLVACGCAGRQTLSPHSDMGYRDYYGPSEEHQPVTYVRGYPIYAAHLIVVVYVASMIVTTVLGPGGGVLGAWLPFSTTEVWRGQFWRIFTYGLVNPPSIRFAIDMVMIVWFGREVERYLGRQKFLALYGGIYLLPPLFLALLGPLLPAALYGEFGALAIFVAFATIQPNAPLMFGIVAKWAAIILVGIFTMMALANRDWAWLISISAANGFAFAFVRHEQGILTLPKINFWRPRPKLRVLPDLEPKKPAAPKEAKPSSMAEIDALLDKIAKTGMSSLTPKERAKLHAAREDLMKRESRGG